MLNGIGNDHLSKVTIILRKHPHSCLKSSRINRVRIVISVRKRKKRSASRHG